MPQGIKLSNQLYPATGDNILSLAEYINDSRWEGQLKDLLSINASLKGSIDDIPEAINNAITLNNIVINTNINNALKQKIVAGTGIFKDNRNNATTEEFQDTLIGIDNTIYGYLNNPLKDPNGPSSGERMYPGCITGIIRGDIDGDGVVNISDVTSMIDRLLAGTTLEESSLELILTLNDSDLFNFDYDIESSQLPYNLLDPQSLIERFLKTLKLFKFVINNIATEPLTSTSSDSPLLNVSINNTALENHIIICNSYNSNKNSTSSSTRDLQYHYSITLTHYYFEGDYIEFPKPAHTDILKGTISVIPGDIPENNLISAAVRTSYENGDYLVEGAFNDPEVIIHDPDNILLFPNQGMYGGVNISDVTALIDFLLNSSWTDESYYLYFSSDSFYLIDENNNRINTCPGIIYLGIDTDLKVHYFISRNYEKDKDPNNSRLYPLKWNTSTLDTQDLLEWLNSTVFADSSNSLTDKLVTHVKKRIYLYFNKLNDSDVYSALYDAYYNEDETLFEALFTTPNTKVIQAPTSNLVIKVPLYLYNVTNPLFDTDNLTIIWDITKDTTVSVSIDESYPISIVDNQGNSVNTMEFSNLNLENPYIVIPIKFNNSDLSKYTYVENGLYYTLKEDVPLTILVDYNVPREDLKLNCQFTNI